MSREVTENKVQVIKTQLKPKGAGSEADWKVCKEMAKEVEELGVEVEVLLNDLAIKLKGLLEKSREAYQAAPMKDTGYGVSPVAPGRMNHAVKRHLIKHGLRLDNTYISDLTTIQDFNDYVTEATKWLLKFSERRF